MITRSGDNILRNSTINHLATVSEDSIKLFIQLHAQFECLGIQMTEMFYASLGRSHHLLEKKLSPIS